MLLFIYRALKKDEITTWWCSRAGTFFFLVTCVQAAPSHSHTPKSMQDQTRGGSFRRYDVARYSSFSNRAAP
uniref:Secreted protein n=1 Tax=Setaria viridis TaxID=4556 RepID=A0A4U6UBL8_SETVI|nr:hypothetical protein SEVIR_5G090850v2 [Setaria viridis]